MIWIPKLTRTGPSINLPRLSWFIWWPS